MRHIKGIVAAMMLCGSLAVVTPITAFAQTGPELRDISIQKRIVLPYRKEAPEEAIRAEQKSVKEKIRENEEKLKSQIYEPTHIRKDPLCPDRNLC